MLRLKVGIPWHLWRGDTQLTSVLGFTSAIGALPDDFNLAVSLFFITFVLFQPPSTAVGQLIGARHWIAIMMVSLFVRLRSNLTELRIAGLGSHYSCTCFHPRQDILDSFEADGRCVRSWLLPHRLVVPFDVLLQI